MENDNRDQTRYVEVQHFWEQPLAWFVWVILAVVLYWMSSADLIDRVFAIVAGLAVLAIMVLVFFTTLTTEISKKGISYRMWPFHKKSKFLEWSEIDHVEVKKYRPLRDYGGWGMRIGRNGRAYNVKGDMGLHIQLNSGQSILLGTQKAGEIEHILTVVKPSKNK